MSAQKNVYEEQLAHDVGGFAFDPLGFVLYAFPWGEGELASMDGPEPWQREELDGIGQGLRDGVSVSDAVSTAIRRAIASGHGIGKSAFVAWIIMWAFSTFKDTRGVVTANTEAQLKGKTWAELSKWHRLCLCGHWFDCTATALISKLPGHEKTWRCDMVPWSERNTEAFAGLHNKGKRVLLIFDEASAIPDSIWDVSEGALTDDDTEIIWVVCGNPTRNTGKFHGCFHRVRHRWHTRQVDSRTVSITNKAQIKEWVDDYGEDSDFVKIRVRGQFPKQSVMQFISSADADAAQKRNLRPEQYQFAPAIIGVDPAWTGEDSLEIFLRQGLYHKSLVSIPRNENDFEIASIIARLEDEHHAAAVHIDAGYGTGIKSAGDVMGRHWKLVWFAGEASDPGYLNKRAEMWGEMKKALKNGAAIDPSDDLLYQDLIGPETVARIDGKIQLESKKDMKKRGLPSPNRGDAMALTYAYPVPTMPPGGAPRKARTSYDLWSQ